MNDVDGQEVEVQLLRGVEQAGQHRQNGRSGITSQIGPKSDCGRRRGR